MARSKSHRGGVNQELINGGVKVMESYLVGLDLEGYFMDLLGGGKNA